MVTASLSGSPTTRPRQAPHLFFTGFCFWHRLAATTALTIAGSVAACASAAPYNPDRLSATQLTQVAQVCHDVMGLSPAERPIWGTHLGDTRLDEGASHYQGCIASLSDSLQRLDAVRGMKQADKTCRARGLQSDSPALAVCVFEATRTRSAAAVAGATPTAPADRGAKAVSVGSFLYASPGETVRREQLACASIGLEPGRAFAHCVKSLRNTFFVIDNPVE